MPHREVNAGCRQDLGHMPILVYLGGLLWDAWGKGGLDNSNQMEWSFGKLTGALTQRTHKGRERSWVWRDCLSLGTLEESHQEYIFTCDQPTVI